MDLKNRPPVVNKFKAISSLVLVFYLKQGFLSNTNKNDIKKLEKDKIKSIQR